MELKNIKGIEWRSGRDTVGIVLYQDPVMKYYIAFIGVAKGVWAEYDALRIAEWGTKLSYREAKGFFPKLKKSDYKKN